MKKFNVVLLMFVIGISICNISCNVSEKKKIIL